MRPPGKSRGAGRRAAAALGLVVLFGALACRPGTPPAPRRPNVVLVTVDALRADRVEGPLGAGMPTLRALAAEGVRFTQAMSPAPLTLPSHASLFTGRDPIDHGVRDDEGFRLAETEHSLAEALAEAGYQTAAVVGAALLNARAGLGQGFARYDDVIVRAEKEPWELRRPAAEVSARALAWLDARVREDAPFFLWVHYFDLHQPYVVERTRDRAYGPYRYLGRTGQVDQALGALVTGLRDRGLADDTLLVVTADHGEGLDSHGELGHGFELYESTLRVPLVWWQPGKLPAGRAVEAPVGLVDVAPTLLSLLGLPLAPEVRVRGRDLGPLLLGTGTLPEAPLLAESLAGSLRFGTRPARALRLGAWKLLRTPAPELYDLGRDPAERANRAAEEPTRVAALERELMAAASEAPPGAVPPNPALARLDRDFARVGPGAHAASHLARLLAGAQGLARLARWHQARAKLAEAQRLAPESDLVQVVRAELHAWHGELDRAIEILDGVRGTLSNPAASRLAGRLYLRAEAWDAAGEVFAGLVERHPDDPWAWAYLGRVRRHQGEAAQAREAFQRALREEPAFPEVHADLGALSLENGEAAGAIEHYRAAVDLDPGAAPYHVGVAQGVEVRESCREALPIYRRALEMDPWGPGAREGVARCLLRLGHVDEAAEHALPLIRVRGDTTLSLSLLGARAVRAGELERARALLGKALEKDPDSLDAWYFLAEARARKGRQEDALEALDHALTGRRRPYAGLARRDPAFAPLRGDPRFSALLAPAGDRAEP